MEDVKVLSDKEIETYFTDDALKMYLREIKKHPLLSKEETNELFYKYKNGNIAAYEKIINSNLRLVVSIAVKYASHASHMELLDIIQEGNFGLIRALETYDPEQSAFSTYAFNWIKQRITRGLDNEDATIRKPVHIKNLIRKYQQLPDGLSDKDIMSKLEISSETLKTIRETIRNQVVSINTKIGDEEDSELEQFIASDTHHDYDDVINKMVNHDLFCILREVLKEKELYIVYKRIWSGDNVTLEDLGKEFNVSRERIRQIEAKALKKIKPYLKNDDSKARVLSKIKEKHGRLYDYIKDEVRTPFDIIKFMYVKEELLDIEAAIYYEFSLGTYTYNRNIICNKFNLNKEELIEYEKSIKLKVRNKLSNKRAFKIFYEENIHQYGADIFNLNVLDNLDIIDYSKVKSECINLSYDEIKNKFGNLFLELTHDEQRLLERFFTIPERNLIGRVSIERDVNLVKYGYRTKKKNISNKKLYRTYLDNIKYFNDEQRLFLECVYFNNKNSKLFYEKYPDSILRRQSSNLIERLECMYFKVFRFYDNSFNKEKYLEVKEKYRDKLSEERIKLLDLFYGVNGEEVKIIDMASMFNMDYIKIHDKVRDAREYAISLYYNRTTTLLIDKDIYVKYINDYKYDFTDETRNILRLFIIDNLSYEEMDNITKLGKYRISNIITDGIRKMDFYRFNIIKTDYIDKELFEEFIKNNKKDYKEDYVIELLRDKFFNLLDNESLCNKYNISNELVNRHSARFYKLFYKYRVKNVSISNKEIDDELNRHVSDGVISLEDKKFIRDYRNLKLDELINKYKLNKSKLKMKYEGIINKIKGRKIGLENLDYSVIPRDELEKIMEDKHLPISDKERHIICSINEINGYSYVSDEDLSDYYNERKANMKRRYQRGLLNIFKYLNGEIEGKIDYEIDVLSKLKYFSNCDRLYLIYYFKDNMTMEEIAKKFNVTNNMIIAIHDRVLNTLKDYIRGDYSKVFDFDYYEEVFMNDDIPYYGDKELAKKVFDMYFGQDRIVRMSLPKIAEELNLPYTESTMIHLINGVLLAVCKYKEGIKKDKVFSVDDVIDYYNRNKDNIGWRVKEYKRYFDKVDSKYRLNGKPYEISTLINYDLIKERYDDCFSIDTTSREEVISLIKKYDHELLGSTKNELMALFDISYRTFMNGKEINHVYRILNGLLKKLEHSKKSVKKLV